MNEWTLTFVAACCAGAMVLLVRAGATPDLRAALRTTMILLLGWILAWKAHPDISPHSWSERTWVLLILSVSAIITSWTLYLLRARKPRAERALSIDQVNIGFAILFAITLFSGQTNSQSGLNGLLIVTGAVILARKHPPRS